MANMSLFVFRFAVVARATKECFLMLKKKKIEVFRYPKTLAKCSPLRLLVCFSLRKIQPPVELSFETSR